MLKGLRGIAMIQKFAGQFVKQWTFVLALTLSSASAALPVFSPLVLEVDGQFEVNPTFKTHARDIVNLAGLSYQVANEFDNTGQILTDQDHVLYQPFTSQGWQITPFTGKTGYSHDDVPGIIAYHSSYHILVVALHGSRNQADWMTNFDAFKVGNETHHLGIEGKLHRGFAVKTSQFKKDLLEKIENLLQSMTLEERETLAVFVTGHSQGAALAHLAGVTIVQFFKNYLKNDLGDEFDNSYQNKVQLYRLSAPRVLGDQEAYDDTTRLIGKHNDIRHNVQGDPVPSAVLGDSGRNVLGGIHSTLAAKVAGYKSSGYLAMQLALPTVLGNIASHTGYLIQNLYDKKKLLAGVLGALHLGSPQEDANKLGFAPDLIDLNTGKLLSQGQKYSEKVTSPRSKHLTRSLLNGVKSIFGF